MKQLSLTLATLVIASAISLQAEAGEVRGIARDSKTDEPLQKVLICLQRADQQDECLKSTFSNKRGQYQFRGINGEYVVRVSAGSNLAARKQNPYPTYSWEPSTQAVSVGKKSKVEVNFSGGFNFSNFQTGLTLTAVDLPELVDGAFLKVYAYDKDGAETTLFLGQVANTASFRLELNVPLTTTDIYYDIFGSATAQGVVDIRPAA